MYNEEENIFDSELFKKNGLTRESFLRYDKMMDERAKSRVPNAKFQNVVKGIECAKAIAEANEAKVAVEYYHDDATITIEGYFFKFHFAFDTLRLLKELLDVTDIVSIDPLIDDEVRLSFDIKCVFDM